MPVRSAAATSSSWSARPSSPASANPDDTTMIPWTPRSPQPSIIPTTVRAGTTNTTRSTPTGRSAIEDRHGSPQTSSYFGFTGCSSPS
jgi:hypothetical protein